MKLPIPARRERPAKEQAETTTTTDQAETAKEQAETTTATDKAQTAKEQAETTATTDQAQTSRAGIVSEQPAAALTDGSTAPAREGGHAVTLKGLNAYYGRQHAIKDVNIDFRANEVTALIGPSGSGKSTVVRCINRMHEEIPGARAEGEVLLDELDLYGPEVDVSSVRRAIGMVFQKPNPFPTMSIFDNVAAGLRLTGNSRGTNLRERVHRSLRSVGLWDEVKNRLSEPGIGLSGGQQQRLCIARTVAVEPEVILMDEPASALDPVSTLKVEELIDELKSRYTIVIVTHNMQQAARVADSTVFMLEGEVIEHAATNKIFTNPDDERTERYVTGKFG
jgi:phosphate transport system ATP-binding protein